MPGIAREDHQVTDLADIVTPIPPSWWPQTTAWGVLGLCVLAMLVALGWRIWRHWRANRYRRAALAELSRLQRQTVETDAMARSQALLAMAALLKRTVLAVWPREAVAELSGPAWHTFLQAHAGKAADAVAPLAQLIDAEYRSASDRSALARWSPQQAGDAAAACRRWIAGHQSPARTR